MFRRRRRSRAELEEELLTRMSVPELAGALGALRVEISELREELEVLRDGLPQAQLERMRQQLSQSLNLELHP